MMRTSCSRARRVVSGWLLVLAAPAGLAQLPPANEAGVGMGHLHLNVPDVTRHREIWMSLGGREAPSGVASTLVFPGVYLLLNEAEPSAPSSRTTINHVGFSVRDYADYRARLEAVEAEFFFDDAENGQIIADLPDGVRIEFLTDTEQSEEIAFHHVHLATSDLEGLRDWYVEVLSAEPGERRGLPSAVLPGARIDILPGEAPAPSRGAAIDHVGFDVADMQAFAERLERLGMEFDRPPAHVDAIGLTIAFITDPAGTCIEVTEGLREAEANR